MGRFSDCESDSSSEAPLDPCLIADSEYGIPKKCYCGGDVFMETSFAKNDPGRRYYTCRLRENNGYHIRKWWAHVVEDELEILHCDIERLKEKITNDGRTGHLNYLTDDFRKAEEAIVELKDRHVQNVEQIAKLELLVREMNKKIISVQMTFVVALLLLLLGLILIWFK